jgi:hypothetical protein
MAADSKNNIVDDSLPAILGEDTMIVTQYAHP